MSEPDDNPLELVTTTDLLNELSRRYETMVFCGATEDEAAEIDGHCGVDWHVARNGPSWLRILGATRVLGAHVERDYFEHFREKPE